MKENRGRSPRGQELDFLHGLYKRGLTNREIKEETHDTEYPLLDNRTYSKYRDKYWAEVTGEGCLEKRGSGPNYLQTISRPVVPDSQIEGHKDFLVSGFDALKCPISMDGAPVEQGKAVDFPPLAAVTFLRAHLRPDDLVLLTEGQSMRMKLKMVGLTRDLFICLNSTPFVSSEVLAEYIRRKKRGRRIYLKAGKIVRKWTNWLLQEEYPPEIRDFKPHPRLPYTHRDFETDLRKLRPTLETRPLVEKILSLFASHRDLALNQQRTVEVRKMQRVFSPGPCEICEPWGGIT